MQDIRFAIRQLLKNKGFTLVAIVTLALGIGANTAIFSIVNSVLLRPLPIPDADRVVQIWESHLGDSGTSVDWAKFIDWRNQAKSFEAIAGADWGAPYPIAGSDRPELARARQVSSAFFHVLRVKPILGRDFSPEDTAAGANPVAIIGAEMWKNRFGSDPNIIGQTLQLDFKPVTIIGVLPANFKMADKGQLFLPQIEAGEIISNRSSHAYQALARLKNGVSIQQAQAEMETIARQLEASHPDTDKDWTVKLVPLREQSTGNVRLALLTLMCAVGFVLLIACANVANLLLTRVIARKREMAIRCALGASQWRLLRQLGIESLLLATIGGGAGIATAVWIVEMVRVLRPDLEAASPAMISLATPIAIDPTALLFSAAISLGVGLFFGIVPALGKAAADWAADLKQDARGNSSSAAQNRSRMIFATAQLALAFVLLTGAGLMTQSFFSLINTKSGFRSDQLLCFTIEPSSARYTDSSARGRYMSDVRNALAAIPGVESVGGALALPLSGSNPGTFTGVIGREPLPEGLNNSAYQIATSGYFDAMGIPFLKGRDFRDTDSLESQLVVIVSETFARKLFPGENPIGKQIGLGDGWQANGKFSPREIIGVVGDVRHNGLDHEPPQQVYIPHRQSRWDYGLTMVLRTRGTITSLAPVIQETVWKLDKDQPISGLQAVTEYVSGSTASLRFNATLTASFAGLALLLATIGIYGTISYSTGQRAREIGVRIALGAQRSHILRLVLNEGFRIIAVGLTVGLLCALSLSHFIRQLLYGIRATDPLTFFAISALMAGVVLCASWIPARRAAATDPNTALRQD